MIGMTGLPELLLFSVILLLIFGKRVPTVMRSLGESVREFRQSVRKSHDLS